jgi:heme-degrading monooxygenase HmoA
MVTIVTDIHLKDGAAGDWDELMRERMAAARRQPGWVGGQLLQPTGDPQRRLIVGTWQTRDDWQAWHHDPSFEETRQELDELVSGPEQHMWHEVVLEVRKVGKAPRAATGKAPGAAGERAKRSARTRAS